MISEKLHQTVSRTPGVPQRTRAGISFFHKKRGPKKSSFRIAIS